MILSDLNHDRPSVKKTIKCHHESGGSVLESIFTNPTILKCVNPGKSQAVCLLASPTLRNCKVIYLGTKHWCSFLCDLVQPSKVFQRDYLYTVLKMNRNPQGARRNDEAPLYPFTLILPYISKVDATGWWTFKGTWETAGAETWICCERWKDNRTAARPLGVCSTVYT